MNDPTSNNPRSNQNTNNNNNNQFNQNVGYDETLRTVRKQLTEKKLTVLFMETLMKKLNQLKGDEIKKKNQNQQQQGNSIEISTSSMSGFHLEPDEKRIITKLTTSGIKEGLLAGCLTFFVLRKGSSMLRQFVEKRYATKQQQHSFTNTTTTSPSTVDASTSTVSKGSNQFHHVQNSPFLPQSEASSMNTGFSSISGSNTQLPSFVPPLRENTSNHKTNSGFGMIMYGIGLYVDFMLSALMAMAATAQFTDYDGFMTEFKTVPLKEGKSQICQEICPAMIGQYEQIKSMAYNNETAEHVDKHDTSSTTMNDHEQYYNDGMNSDRNHDVFDSDNNTSPGLGGMNSSDTRNRVPGNGNPSSFVSSDLRECLDHPETPIFRGLLDFSINCRKRYEYQKILYREQQHFGDTVAETTTAAGIENHHDITTTSSVANVHNERMDPTNLYDPVIHSIPIPPPGVPDEDTQMMESTHYEFP